MDRQNIGIGASIAFKNSAWFVHVLVDELIKHIKETKQFEIFYANCYRNWKTSLYMKKDNLWIEKPLSDIIRDFK